MSEVRLLVREAGQDWSGTVHGSIADRAIAALSADPWTLADLETACARFARLAPERPWFISLSPGSCDEPYDAGIVVIDLVAHLVVVASTYSSPRLNGEVRYHDGQRGTGKWLRYYLDEDWLLTHDRLNWPALAEQRRRERAARPLLDARAVLYGRPLLNFIARETFAAFASRMDQGALRTEQRASSHRQDNEEPVYDTLKQIHACWLLTPRGDLGGTCPRDVGFERRDHLNRDMQNQCERWSLLEECPPGLDPSSMAFRYGRFGTHELVLYYNLIRELLWSCWEQLIELEKTPSGAGLTEKLAIEDFLTSEVPRLERTRDRWLDEPDPDFHGRTPRSIINRERARLPEGLSGPEAMIDPDCPCCQMLAEMPGPTFWHLDGSEMDHDFAFDIFHRTREEWEAHQRLWEEHSNASLERNETTQAKESTDWPTWLGVDDELRWGEN